MSNGFIKNKNLLEEKVSDKDYLDISSSVETLSEKLLATKGSQMVGVIGAFGVGKSTLIEQIKKKRVNDEQWIHFDAWQFPERKELWDGLVLETARQLSKLEKYKRKVDGQSGKDKKLAVSTAGSAVNLVTTAFGLPLILEPLFALVKNLDYFAEKSPARRVFEIQDIFIDLINTIDNDKVVFVIEDIDRSGQDGLFFLETFRQFLSKNNLKKQVVVIVAISNASYYENLDTYLKCLDYVEFFNKKSDIKLESFISDVFESDIAVDTQKLVEFLEYIYSNYPDMNMRKIKLILRQANLNYIELMRLKYEPNWLICIAISASKYINFGEKEKTSYFDHFVKLKTVTSGNAIARLILVTNGSYLQYANRLIVDEKKELLNTFDIGFTKRIKPEDVNSFPSTPHGVRNTFASDDQQDHIGLPDFYFKDL